MHTVGQQIKHIVLNNFKAYLLDLEVWAKFNLFGVKCFFLKIVSPHVYYMHIKRRIKANLIIFLTANL